MNRQSQTMNNTQTKQRKSKKTTIAVVAIALSCVLLIGSLFAFFSDRLNGTGTAVAGTVDIVEVADGSNGYILTRYDAEAGKFLPFDGEKEILNPGDYLQLQADLRNDGSKSFWLHTDIEFKLSKELFSQIDFYDGAVEYGKAAGAAPADIDIDEENLIKSYCSTLGIMNGSKENEDYLGTPPGADTHTILNPGKEGYKDAYTDVLFTIVFNGDAGNEAQAKGLDFEVTMKALQFRNNTDLAADAWDNVVPEV